MKNLLIIVIMLGFAISELSAQSARILTVRPNYPNVSMEFKMTGSDNKEIRDANTANYELFDGTCGKINNFTINCLSGGECKLSYLIVIDVSASMFEVQTGGKTIIQEVRDAFINFLSGLDPSSFEATLIGFASNTYHFVTFTNDIQKLKDGFDDAIRQGPRGQTNFNAGLLRDCYLKDGALFVAENALYKPVVLFLSDGGHNFQNPPPGCTPSPIVVQVSTILAKAASLPVPATIGAIKFGGTSIPQEMCDISKPTPLGDCFLASDKGALQNWLSDIRSQLCTIAPPPPCTITWETCCGGGDVTLIYKPTGKQDDTVYSVDPNTKPYLEVSTNPYFLNIVPLNSDVKSVTVTARNNDVKFDATTPFTLSDNNFQLLPKKNLNGYTLKKDSSVVVDVKYTSPDSMYHKADITFNSTACNGNNWSASAGWIFTRNTHVGGGVLGQDSFVEVDGVFCNRSGKALTINGTLLSQGNYDEFEVIEPSFPLVVQDGDCIKFKFRFHPNAEGLRKTTLVVQTTEGNFSGDLMGDGSGYANIIVGPGNNINYPNANCRNYYHDTTIVVGNNGALPLNVSAITLSNSTDFESIGWPTIPFTLQPNKSQDIVVRFAPKSIGTFNSTMTITSDSKYNSSYNVDLSGVRDSIGFSVSSANVDFGQLCPDETGNKNITISNTGTLPVTVVVTDIGGFTIAPNSWTIPVGGSENITISFTSSTEGSFTNNLIFEDNFCNFTKSVSVKAEVVTAKISQTSLVITATVGDKVNGTMTIRNTSTRDLTITQDDIDCGEFKVIAPPKPWNITAGGSIDIQIEYAPVNENFITCFIKLTGTQCNFLDSVKVEGNPNLALATIQIEKHSGLAGFPVTIPILLRNLNKIAESGATAVNTRISYDQNLLAYQNISNGTVVQGTGYVDISNMNLSAMSGDIIANLTFMVNISTPETTLLDLTNSETVNGFVRMTESDGEFTLNRTSAVIYIDNIEGKTGEVIDVPVKISSPTNLSSVHKNIQATLIFNYSLLEPIGSTPVGTIQNDQRVIDLTLPVSADANGVLQTFQFRAMLGTSDNTELDLRNTKVSSGQATFTENDGNFKLTNVCISSDANNPNPRLFDPKGQAQIISMNPNPSDGESVLMFEAQEEGMHTISIYSQIGVRVSTLLDSFIKAGIYEITFNTDKLANGSYYILYNTPTKKLTKVFGIMK